MHDDTPKVRFDKWLWAARFYKTRSLAAEEVGRGRVMVNGQLAKPARELRRGDRLSLRQGNAPVPREVVVQGLSAVRGPAPVARLLYEETAESVQMRTRFVGHQPYVEVSLGTPRGGSLEQAHQLTEAVERVVQDELEGANVLVHVVPARTATEPSSFSVRFASRST